MWQAVQGRQRRGLMAVLLLANSEALATEAVMNPVPLPMLASVAFDGEVLKARGIDPKLADYFRYAPRFREGLQVVTLTVNGVAKGRVPAQFDGNGALCVDEGFLLRSGIRIPDSLANGSPVKTKPACVGFMALFSGAVVQLNPGSEQVALLVPTDALVLPGPMTREYSKGGVAGLFNYDALLMGSDSGGATQYRSLNTEVGLNAGDWALRSRQVYTEFEQQDRLEHLYAYASHTWETPGVNVQLGQLNLASPLFAGEAFNGVQFLPESALTALGAETLNAGAMVEGIAYSTARVEVRQSAVVIYTAMVPSGPFTLRDLPLLSRTLDLDVRVYEEDGQQRGFIVPAASLRGVTLGTAPGYAFAAGRTRRFGSDDREAPSFVAGSKDWQLSPATRFSTGLMAGTGYQSLAASLERVLGDSTVISGQQTQSREQVQGTVGGQYQLTLGSTFSRQWSASLSALQQTEGFRTLSDTTWDWKRDRPDVRIRNQLSSSLNWTSDGLGSFGTSYSRYTSFAGEARSHVGGSWSTMFNRTSLSLTVESDVGRVADSNAGAALYLTLNTPLDRQRSVRGYVRHDPLSGTRTGARLNDQVSDTLAYSVGVERPDNGLTDYDARLNVLPHYAQVDLGYSRRGTGDSSYDFGARGGVVLHADGVTLSPYPLRETFGLLSVGEVTGVKLDTPHGPVWTDGAGRAVVASLPAYRKGRVEIDTASLARNVDVVNGHREVEAGRGSVQRLAFEVVTVRRLLLQARTVDERVVAKGVGVYNANGEYVTSVLDDGRIFLANAHSEAGLQVVLPDGERCRLEYAMPHSPEAGALYETAEAHCREV